MFKIAQICLVAGLFALPATEAVGCIVRTSPSVAINRPYDVVLTGVVVSSDSTSAAWRTTINVRRVVEGAFRERRYTFGSEVIMTPCDGSFWGPMQPGAELALYLDRVDGRLQVRHMHLLSVARQIDRRFGRRTTRR
jgi:hypothetical protein